MLDLSIFWGICSKKNDGTALLIRGVTPQKDSFRLFTPPSYCQSAYVLMKFNSEQPDLISNLYFHLLRTFKVKS